MKNNLENSKSSESVKEEVALLIDELNRYGLDVFNNDEDKYREDKMETINRGLKDLDDGKVYSHNTARKIYERYL